SATGRSGFGNALAGAPASAMNSCAEPDTVRTAAKKAAIVIRIIASITLGVNVPFQSVLRTWSDAEYFSDVPAPAIAKRIVNWKISPSLEHSPKRSSEDRTAALEAGLGPKLAGVIVRIKGWSTSG